MRRNLTLTAALACSAAQAPAGPLETRLVPAGTTWVVHLDVAGAMGSDLGRFALSRRDRLDLGELDDVRERTGIDPLSTVLGVTVYGAGPDEENAVVLISATGAADELVRHFTEQHNFRREDHGGLPLYVLAADGEQHYLHVHARGAERLMFLSENVAALRDGVAVAVGEAPSLAGLRERAVAVEPGPGSILYIAAAEVSSLARKARDRQASEITKKVSALALDLGQHEGQFYADLALTTTRPEDATNIMLVAQGLIAGGRLMAQNNAELARACNLLDSLAFTTQGREVRVKWRVDTAVVLDAIRAAEGGGADAQEPQQEVEPSRDPL